MGEAVQDERIEIRTGPEGRERGGPAFYRMYVGSCRLSGYFRAHHDQERVATVGLLIGGRRASDAFATVRDVRAGSSLDWEHVLSR